MIVKHYVIAFDKEDEVLFWTNGKGWGKGTADVFSADQREGIRLPLGGRWVAIGRAEMLSARLRSREEALKNLLSSPPRHIYWRPGEADCPKDVKAPNGELHTLRCKVCDEDNPKDEICRAAVDQVLREATDA